MSSPLACRGTLLAALLALAGSGAAEAVVLTTSDGVIRNSLCVGFDCPNSPSFSDTTILMMENNTRIKFDDTSTASSFPRNDWEIEANSSVNGGASYLGVNDCGESSQGGCATDLVFAIEAGVRQSALYVESDGDVGIGTSNPVGDVHIVTGNTPFLRLEQDGSSGFEPQTWDVAGNETNFFIRDATFGSALPLRIQPGAGSNAIFVRNNGAVGLGTSSPGQPLHVRRTNGTAQILVEEASAAVAGRVVMKLQNNGPTRLQFENSGAGNLWNFAVDGGNNFNIDKPGVGAVELALDNAGNLAITGQITTSGSCSIGCDRVFAPDFPLESIEEHAERMFADGHLPAVGPTPEDAPFNLSQKTGGMLNELEKAHIYIMQLHEDLERKEGRLAELEERLLRLERGLAADSGER